MKLVKSLSSRIFILVIALSIKASGQGDLYLFKGGEIKCKEFREPGSAVVFPSFTNHRVEKLTSGNRATLAIWMHGPKFR